MSDAPDPPAADVLALARVVEETAKKSRKALHLAELRIAGLLADLSRTSAAATAALAQRVDALERTRARPRLVSSQDDDAWRLRRLLRMDAIALTTLRAGVKNLSPLFWPGFAQEIVVDLDFLLFAAREFAVIEREKAEEAGRDHG